MDYYRCRQKALLHLYILRDKVPRQIPTRSTKDIKTYKLKKYKDQCNLRDTRFCVKNFPTQLKVNGDS